MGENIFSKSITVLVFVSTCIAQQALGQITDNFDDGNFTEAPAWTGSAGNFVVNGSHQLQLNAQAAGSSMLLLPFSVPINHNTEWEFYISHTFASSASNNSRVYLMSNSADLTGSLNGYYLQFGENLANDAVELFKQTGNTSTSVLRGPQAQIAANFTVRVRVTRSSIGEWQLFIDPSGGTNFTATPAVSDNTHTTSDFFGIRCLYSISNTTRFYFDDFNVETSLAPDVTAPQLTSISIDNNFQIALNFSEALDQTQILTAGDFILNDTLSAIAASFENSNSSIQLTFEQAMKNGRVQKIHFPALADLAANVLQSSNQNFLYFAPVTPLPNDIVINEIYPDPSPSLGLPPFEFIEIYNRSDNPFQLQGWKITDGSTTGVLGNLILLPKEYLILVPNEAVSMYSLLGATMGLQFFPALNNSGDDIQLKSPDGTEIDVLSYTLAAYHDEDKDAGGFTIERINPNDFCSGIDNWKASTQEKGGTPGVVNSVFELTEDFNAPDFVNVSIVDRDTLVLSFSEGLRVDAVHAGNFLIEPILTVDTIHFTDASRRSIAIHLNEQMDSLLTYRITLQNIFDCPGNLMPPDSGVFEFKLDSTLPEILSVTTIDERKLRARFTKKIKFESITQNNFLIPDIGVEKFNTIDPYTLELVLSSPLTNGENYLLTITGITDLAGNVSGKSDHAVLYFKSHPVSRKDIIISEIFADPTPPEGLPETEFIEIFNRSENPIQLKNWSVNDETHEARLKAQIILPGNHLTLTTASKAFQFENVMGVSSFPTLTNAGEPLILRDSLGVTIDSVFYSDDWYRDSEKKDGGWSLELIDPENTCAEGENWTASENLSGGTPGKINSVVAEKPDLSSPEIVSVFASSAETIELVFNEKLGRETPRAEDLIISPAVAIDHIAFSDQTKRSYTIKLSAPLENRVRYSIGLKNISDCAGNEYQNERSLFFVLPEEAEPADIIVNEILFNPRPTGVDFIELYNRSEKYINFKNWRIANLVNDTLINLKHISEADFVFEPGDFLVLTSDPNVLKGEYLQGLEEKMRKTILPTLSDDEGSVLILDEEERIIDTLFYSDDQHSPFLKDTEGVSLERVDINSPSSNKSNWQSASASSGYATPGFGNGSALQNTFEEAVSVEPEIFSPLAGQPDFAMIAYNFDHAGYVANVKIVNQQGRVIKTVAENELLGTQGFFTWRGDTTDGAKATVGAYMVWFEAFDDSGNVVTQKKRVVIAERF